MKRIIAAIVAVAILICCVPFQVLARETPSYQEVNIDIVVDKDGSENEISLPAIIKGEELYMHPQNIAKITRYIFEIIEKGYIFRLGKKFVMIDKDGKKLLVNQTEQPFSGVLDIEGSFYFPLSELLPWMNVQCYVDSQKLHVDSDLLSLWEVIDGFMPTEYKFDLSEQYLNKEGGTFALLSVFCADTWFNIFDAWKKFKISESDTSVFEYEIYKNCFREFAVPDTGTEAELQKSLSELYQKISSGSQFANETFDQLFNEDTYEWLYENLGSEYAAGFKELPVDAKNASDSLNVVKTSLKYLKASYIMARIISQDTEDYANTLQYIYLRDGNKTHSTAARCASEIIPLLRSDRNEIGVLAGGLISDVRSNFLDTFVEKGVELSIKKASGDILMKSLKSYLDLVNATLSLTWPINESFEETSEMIIYQSIQTDAIEAYTSKRIGSSFTVQDLAIIRMSAILLLRTAKKCYSGQQEFGDLLGENEIHQHQIDKINSMILRFSLAKEAEKRDAIFDRSEEVQRLKQLWRELHLSASSQNSSENTSTVKTNSFRFDLNTSNGYEDYISFKPDESGWYTFTADGTGYFWMEAPNREMTEYRLEGHVFSEYGLHYYLSGDQQYYIKLCANSEANGELFVEESQFPSLTEGETLQLPLADCYGGFDGGGYAINYFSFTPSSSGIYYFSCGTKDIFTRSATWGIARDAYGNGIQIINTTENEAGITTMEYQLIAGNTYYFGLSASPGGICNISVSSNPYESGDKTDNLLLSNFPDEFIYSSGVGAWMTVINLEQNGAFTGIYHDTNAGETGNDYPNGTTYICGFSGEFTDFVKVNEYTYSTSLFKILTEKAPGEVYYEDGVRYITTDPYGFTNADVFYMYLPGTPYSAIPEGCSEWFIHYNLTTPLPSDTFVLYNVNGGEVFIGNVDIPTDTDGRNYKVLESDISGVITDITGKLNIRSGPGTSYEVVGYLFPNDTVEVYETAHNEDITWGHIEQGWISMDYVGNITHRNSANIVYAEDYVDFTTAEILAELGPEYDIPGAYAGSYLLKTINYPDFYFAYNNDNSTSQPYITGFESVVCIYVFGDAAINEYLSANMSKPEIDEVVHNPDVLSFSTDTVYIALDDTGSVFQYIIETHKSYITYEWYLDSGSSLNNPADGIFISAKKIR